MCRDMIEEIYFTFVYLIIFISCETMFFLVDNNESMNLSHLILGNNESIVSLFYVMG